MALLNDIRSGVGSSPLGRGLGSLWGGGKDVLRQVPGVNSMLGLASPEEQAANAQRSALGQAGQQYNRFMGQAGQQLSPYAGLADIYPMLQEQLMSGQYQTQLPGYEDYPQYQDFEYNLEEDPSFQFAQQQGLRGVESSLAARGLTGSGREMQELARYSTGLASQYAPQMRQQAFNEYQQGYNNRVGQSQYRLNLAQLQNQINQQQFGNLAGLAGVGMGARQNMADLYSQQGQGLASLATQRGDVTAAQKMAEANSWRNLMGQGAQLAGSQGWFGMKPIGAVK
jgi:hypothetical protein